MPTTVVHAQPRFCWSCRTFATQILLTNRLVRQVSLLPRRIGARELSRDRGSPRAGTDPRWTTLLNH